MLKKNLFNSIILLFIGISIIYIFNKPPTVILKYPKLDTKNNVNYSSIMPSYIV